MDALIRKINTYGGYTEHWSDGRLYISYRDAVSHDVAFDGASWEPTGGETGTERQYLASAAAVQDAAERCQRAGYPASRIYEFLPERRDDIIGAELCRVLLDELGLGIDEALAITVRALGKNAAGNVDMRELRRYQPRTANLARHIISELAARPMAFHNAYDEYYRSPVGAVEAGSDITLRIAAFGGVGSARVHITGDDGYSVYIPMRREGDSFSAHFTPDKPAALFYEFELNGGDVALECDAGGRASRLGKSGESMFRLTAYEKGFTTPEWFRRGTMYQIFPDRFGFSHDGTAERGIEYHRALGQTPQLHESISEPVKWQPRPGEKDYAPDDFYGGTLKGIAQKLPYLKQLGITVVYLNPVVEARSDHRYDTSDYENVDPILGSVADYEALCAEAEKFGIKIINDGVYSHTGADSKYFDRYGSYGGSGAYLNRSSPYFGWYDFRSYPDDYRCWWNFKDLPEVNEQNKSWQDYIITGKDSIVKLWLRRGASGWRLDVADELPNDILDMIRTAAKSEKPDSVIIGEVWEDAVLKISYGARRRYALGTALDSVMNYPFRAAVISFLRGESDSFALRDALAEQQFNYPKPLYLALMNLLSSHDVERVHTALGAPVNVKSLSREQQAAFRLDKAQADLATKLQMLGAAIQYCCPGVPCLYYGDEECLDGAGDPFDRAPFEPSGKGLHNYYVRLGEIRSGSKAILSGSCRFASPTPDVLTIERECASERILCVINRGLEPYTLPGREGEALLRGSLGGIVEPYSAEIFRLK